MTSKAPEALQTVAAQLKMEPMCVIAYKKQGVSWTVCKSVFNSSGGKVRKLEEDKLLRKDSKPSESTKSKQQQQKKEDSMVSISLVYVLPLKKWDN